MYPHNPLKQERKTWDILSLASATRVITVERRPLPTLPLNGDQRTSSREQPNGDDHPFPVQEATA